MTAPTMVNGQYAFDHGYKNEGSRSQQKFYCGKDLSQFEIRKAMVKEVLRIKGGSLVWAEPFLTIAKAVGKGVKELELDLGAISPDHQVEYIEAIQRDLPFIRLRLPAQVAEQGKAVWSQFAIKDLEKLKQTIQPDLDWIKQNATLGGLRITANGLEMLNEAKGTLFEAFDYYIEQSIKLTNIDTESKKLKNYGRLRIRRVNRFKRDIKEMGFDDMPLSQLNGEMCERLCTFYKNRPLAKRTNKPVSKKDATHCIRELTRFIKWLNRTERFNWSKPKGFEDLTFTVEKTKKEKKIKNIVRAIYSIEELTTIVKHATDYDRLIIFTCLNCGFGAAEIGRVETADILFNHSHEFTEQLVFDSSDEDTFLRFLRPKTGVFGEWLLWPETVDILKRAVARAENIGSDVVLCSDSGKPIYDEVNSENPQSRFANKWDDLLKRVRKSHPDFRRLPFGSLRETLPDYIRHRYDGELASIGLAHGSPYDGDNLLECYTGKPFGRFHKAMRELHSLFLPVLTAPSAYTSQTKRYKAIERTAQEVA